MYDLITRRFAPSTIAATVAVATAAASAAPSGQPHGELIGVGVARFFASEEAARVPRESPFFVQQPAYFRDLPQDFAFQPDWVRTDDITTITIEIPADATLYGLGRAPGDESAFLRQNQTFTTPEASPWILGINGDGSAFGILLDTPWTAAFDLAQTSVTLSTPDPDPALIIMKLRTPTEVTLTLAGLTGRLEMPPLWALGVQTSDHRNAPAFPLIEGAWIDCNITAPEPQACLLAPGAEAVARGAQEQIAHGRIAVAPEDAEALSEHDDPPTWIRDEGDVPIKVDGNYIPDFTSPRTRRWWARQIKALGDAGALGFVAPQRPLADLPADAQLAGDRRQIWVPGINAGGPLAQFEGVYSLLAARATWEAFEAEERDKRVLVAIPTASLGAQQWTVHFIEAASQFAPTPRHLIGAALNSSLTVQHMVGASLPDPASMNASEWQEWVAAASLLPLMHLQKLPAPATIPDDPEAATPDPKHEIFEAAASLRMQLLPHLYTAAFQNLYVGDLILRPLFMHEPQGPADTALRDIDTAFFLGPDLLVVPPLGDDTFRVEDYFPDWRLLEIGDPDPRLPALYMRPGSILPLAPAGDRTATWSLDPLTIVVALGPDGQANGYLYEDEWNNFGLFRNESRRLTYNAIAQNDVILIRLHGMDGGWGMPIRDLHVRVLTDDGELTAEGSERGTIRIPIPDP